MNINWKLTFIVCAAFFIVDLVLKRKFPKLWEQVQLLSNIIASAISVVFVSMLAYAIYDVSVSDVSMSDKVFFSILMAATIVLWIFANISVWKRWLRERRNRCDDNKVKYYEKNREFKTSQTFPPYCGGNHRSANPLVYVVALRSGVPLRQYRCWPPFGG